MPEGLFNLEAPDEKMLLVFSVKVTGWLIIFNTLKKITQSSLMVDQSHNKMVSYLLGVWIEGMDLQVLG